MRYQNGAIRFFGIDDKHSERLPQEPEAEKEIRAMFAAQREALLELPSQTDGLNLESIESFWETQGLPTSPYIVIEEDDFEKVDKILGENTNPDDIPGGVYKHWVDVSIVVRNEEAEATNGRGFTEGMIVHEQAHSTSDFFDITYKVKMDGAHYRWFHRRGFITESLYPRELLMGEFFEEAFCDTQRIKYLGSIGLSDGHLKGYPTLAIEVGNKDVGIPPKYANRSSSGQLQFIPSALAAWGFELLVERMRGLNNRSLRARSSISEIAKFAATINRIQPGLYSELRKAEYSYEDFAKGLVKVIHATGRSSEFIHPISK